MPRSRIRTRFETDSALVVVRAPAGAGKTVAVADWATQCVTDGVWLSVREEMSSPRALWAALLRVLADANLLPPDGVLERSMESLDEVVRLRDLLIRGFAQVPQPIVLILDGVQPITDPEFYEDLAELLASTPRLRAIVISRALSPLESAGVRLSLSPVIVGAEDLELNFDDTMAALQAGGLEVSGHEFAGALRTATGGNPLLVRGIILAIQRGELPAGVVSIQDVLTAPGTESLIEAVLARSAASEDIDFAVRCSVPDVLTAELAEELTGRRDAGALLDKGERSGIGMWSDGAEGLVFSLSPVFRSILRAELGRRFPGEIARLERISAEWAHRNGRVFEALTHALAAGDLDLASTIVMQDWHAMTATHRRATIIDQLGSLSLRALHRHPILAMMLGLTYNATAVHKIRAMEMFGIVALSTRVRAKSQPKTMRLLLLLLESSALRLTGRIEGAVRAADRAIELRRELSFDEQDALARTLPTFLNQIGQTYFYHGQVLRSLELFREALAYPKSRAPRGWYHGLALTAGASAVRGQMDDAAQFIETARTETWPEGWRDGYYGAMYQLAESFLALEAFDTDLAERHIQALAPHLDTIEHWPLILHLNAMICLTGGRAAEGLALLGSEPSKHARRPNSFTSAQLDATTSLLLLAAGRPAEADAAVRKLPKTLPAAALALARIALVGNRPEEATRLLAAMASKEQELSPRTLAQILLVQAAAALRRGHDERALSALGRAAVVLCDHRMRFPLMLIPHEDLEALKRSADDNGVTLAGGILDTLDDIPDVLPASLATASLTERERVVLEHLITTGNVAEIAEQLFVSTNTIKSQLRSIYRKLGVSSREEALLVATERQVIRD
ncbi:helix-turn-helix transcriptional regulator [Parafrigoribacterium soli]|uniref:helix-turn-helix transcriptional regulator n=1 Tax=Parafrigoribacterium soli TaxID=3144663 RepID=UPI0032F07950